MKCSKVVILSLFLGINCFAENKNLNNIVLVINYNHAHYESVPLIKKIYEKYFNKIVFYGPKAHPDVNFYDHNMGYRSYMCIADAMKKNQNCDGYLFLMDDCILNAWLLDSFDKSKIWLSQLAWVNNANERGLAVDMTKGQDQLTKWEWWGSKWGYSQVSKAFAEIPANHKKMLTENAGPSHVVVGFSDVVYVPSKYKEQFIELATIFGKYDVFLEIALPTIMHCLSPKGDWLWLPGNNTYAQGFKDFKVACAVNHPIKLSSSANRSFVTEIFNQG